MNDQQYRVNRRGLLRATAILAASTAAAGLVGGVQNEAFAQSTRSADTLRIGVGTEATTLDPHFYNLTPNSETSYHIFEYLVSWDEAQNLGPGLASSWTQPADDTWVFNLREGVTFQDGTPFTAEDVVFSINRAPNVPNSPASFGQFTARIVKAEATAPHTLKITTNGPHPYLLSDMTQIAVVSHIIGANATTEDYNSGKAAIGTGPYRLKEWVRGDRLVYERNEKYWGTKPAWKTVLVKPITAPAARVSALLAKDVDLINQIPSTDIKRLRQTSGIRVQETPEPRLFYMSPDVERDKSPFVTDKQGNPLDRNPLKDVRVRRAISKAMNRDQLVERIMDGLGESAGQFVPEKISGANPAMKPESFDIEGAKKLLAEAGYPDGFGMTIHGPNDRYVNDAKILQAVAQMLTRIGIAVKVETLPKSVYFTRVANFEFSFQLVGTSADIGGGGYSVEKYLVHTPDAKRGLGAGNRGHYSSPKVDALLDKASVTLDQAAREKLLQDVAAAAIGEDVALIPLFFGMNTWAMASNLNYVPRSDGFTLAAEVTAAK
jgi:peptide/nickel transport system substrate-binding protein